MRRAPSRSRPLSLATPTPPEPTLPATWWTGDDYRGSVSAQVESVSTLLDHLKHGDYQIPPFQRAFVWTDADVIALLDSLLRGYHVGTLITWEQRDPAAATTLFGGVALHTRADRVELVLDGQQRLGALARAFLAPGFSFDVYTGTFAADAPPSPTRCACTMFDDFLALNDWARDDMGSEHQVVWRLAARAATRILRAKIPVVRLPAEYGIAEAVEMFRRLNSAGVRMPVEDLERILRGYLGTAGQGTP